MKKFLLMGCAALAMFTAAAQTYKPALQLTAGKKYNVTVSIKGSTSQEAMGQKMEMPMESVTYQLLDIKGATDNAYQAANTTSRLTMSMSMMGQDMSYDSDKKADRDGKLGEGLNKLVGKTTTFDVNKEGTIIEKSIAKPKSDEEGGQDMIGAMMSSMGMSDAPSPVFNLFAEVKDMKAGETYTETKDTDKEGDGKTVTVYTFTGIKDGAAMFTFTGNGTLEKKMTMQGMEMMVNTTTKTSGEMSVDTATGLLIKKTVNMESTGKIEVQGTEVPTTSNMVTTIVVAPAQ
jgi:hypothetical protein